MASVVLPKESRRHLLAFYGFARLVDYIGDDYSGDRLHALNWLECDTKSALDEPVGSSAGPGSHHPLVVEAATSVRDLRIDPQPLFDLIEANRRDQLVASYETFDHLLDYCRLSANPVGRLVLGVFGVEAADRLAYSDAICTGLQLAEHWQDVMEDALAGRVYLPREDLHRFDVDAAMLVCGPANPELRALMVFEVARARSWLDRGLPLLTRAHRADPLGGGGILGRGPRRSRRHRETGLRCSASCLQAAGVVLGPPHVERHRVERHCIEDAVTMSRSEESAVDEAYDRCEAITAAEAR